MDILNECLAIVNVDATCFAFNFFNNRVLATSKARKHSLSNNKESSEQINY